MSKGAFLTILLFGIGIALFVGILLYVGVDDIANALKQLDLKYLIPVVLLMLLEASVSTFRWRYIINSLGEKIPFRGLFPIWLAGNAINYLSPVVYVGGEGFRIFLLKQKFRVAYYRGSASVFLDQIFNGLSVWPMVVFGFIIFFQNVSSDELNAFFFVLLLITTGIFCALLWGLYRVFHKKPVFQPLIFRFHLENKRIGGFLIRMENEMMSFRNLGVTMFWNALGLSFLRQSIILLRTALILVAIEPLVKFNINSLSEFFIDVKNSVIISTSVYVSYLVPIPLAVGGQEVAGEGVFEILGWTQGAGVLFAFIYRSSEMMMVLPGAFILIILMTQYGLTKNLVDAVKNYKGEVKKVSKKITQKSTKKVEKS